MKPLTHLLTTLKQATTGLEWMSESDFPFEVVHWQRLPDDPLTPADFLQLAGYAADTPIADLDLDDFFAMAVTEEDWYGESELAIAHRYQHLVALLKAHLDQLRVYQIGCTTLDVYVVGEAETGHWIGLSTKAVET